MATFVVCARCGKVKETDVAAPVPADWRLAENELHCPSCASAEEGGAGDVLDEEVVYPAPGDTLDESFDDGCEVCGGPCRGH